LHGCPRVSSGHDKTSTTSTSTSPPGLPDGIFSNQNPYLGKFWRILQWNDLVYFTTIWYMYVFYGHLVYLMVFWYFFHVLVFCIKKNLATLFNISVHFNFLFDDDPCV
jgi:hypothetical protein